MKGTSLPVGPSFAAPPGEPRSSKKSALALTYSVHSSGDVVFIVDCFYGADGLAGAAVHAFIRVDVQGAFAFVDAVDGAFFNACAVFDIHAGKRDYVGHWCAFLEAVRPVPAVLRVVCCRAESTE